MKLPKKPRKSRVLRPGEAKFVAESIKPGLSKVEAARRAGLDYVPQGAHVARYRQELIRKQMTLADISTERTLLEIARVAYFDPRRMFDDRGNLIPVTQLDDDTAACIAGLDVERRTEGKGEDAETYYVMKIKISNKVSALDLLTKLDLEARRNGKNGPLQPPPLDQLDQALAKLVQQIESRVA